MLHTFFFKRSCIDNVTTCYMWFIERKIHVCWRSISLNWNGLPNLMICIFFLSSRWNESLYSNLSQYSQVKYLSLNSYKYEISDLPGLFKIWKIKLNLIQRDYLNWSISLNWNGLPNLMICIFFLSSRWIEYLEISFWTMD
jgi:hypothetical protein